jgi:DNA repair protein RadA/Sms
VAKKKSVFVCQACGAEHPRWSGRCEECGAWNTVSEESAAAAAARGSHGGEASKRTPLAAITEDGSERATTGIAELDRVLGGGLVRGGAVLIGGDPGVGKSTLLLTAAAAMARDAAVLYVAAEEAPAQIAARARRLGLPAGRLELLGEDRLEPILDAILDAPPRLVVIDSIQTIRKESLGSAAGSVAQVRECAADLAAAARRVGCAVVFVGHVTKDGMIAGPKVLEHLVDVVLYFEGERDQQYRLLRAVKNRFGPSGEVAVFAMSERGLEGPDRPAAAFLGAARAIPGAVIGAAVEGTRVFLVEVQALTSRATYGPPRVRANGVEPARAAMLAAVLARRCGLELLDQDVHLNVAGGFRLSDPGCDLAVCLAIASSFLDRVPEPGTVVCGEVGLGGEVRPVRHLRSRLREAAALGFSRMALPAANEIPSEVAGIEALPFDRLANALELLGGVPSPPRN